ncbi:MAG TPA: hypothetical protein VNJ11_07875 [Bryobacteraceae bacterium]|nr:hypothetical protein [Bryobacteraceae bacterium]
MLRATVLLTVTVIGLAAQELGDLLQKAPPELDAALRARISRFYQAHVDGKFREAYELVAEDSKDIFFAAEKPRYRSFNILKIDYSDNFTKAKAVVACETEASMFGNRFTVQMPVTSLWKLADGQWYWYTLPPSDEVITPAGVMKPGPAPQTTHWKDLGTRAPRIPALQTMVRADKTQVNLNLRGESSDTVKITNTLPGPVTLSLEYQAVPGLEVQLDREQLAANETATVTFRSRLDGQLPSADITVTVRVMPTAQLIPIRVMLVSEAVKPVPVKSR